MNKPKSVDEYHKEAPQSEKIEFKPFSQRLLEQKIAECERLQKQLDITVKALRGVRVWANTGNGGEQAVKKLCNEALKKIEELNK